MIGVVSINNLIVSNEVNGKSFALPLTFVRLCLVLNLPEIKFHDFSVFSNYIHRQIEGQTHRQPQMRTL